LEKKSGILIHPTSFPGKYGCGDLGEGAYKIIDILKQSGQKILQILPLGPTGFGDSPYQSFSASAGTPYIISFDKLIEDGLLTTEDLADYPDFSKDKVDYYGIYINNFKILRKAFAHFQKIKTKPDSYKEFCKDNKQWLDDYALFMSIKDSKNGASWDMWEDELRLRTDLKSVSKEILIDADFYKFIQWKFSEQWLAFKKYANDNDIEIVGDVPIFVSYDSSDVWANQELFHLDSAGKPTLVAGVPPDYFSATGQLWGNPHYKWDIMQKNGFKWWVTRFENTLKLVDCIRVDHFRGFEAYWEVKSSEKTAMNGKWVKAPGVALFNKLKEVFGSHLSEDVIAEDLGIITKEVNELKDRYNFPGMKIFEFAPFGEGTFTDENNNVLQNHLHAYRPENYPYNCVAYPGTHDNNTILGWFDSLTDKEKTDVLAYLKTTKRSDVNIKIIEKLMKSNAKWVVYMMQDVLCLPAESRMNTPGTCGIHNWSWRITYTMLEDMKNYFKTLKTMTADGGRA